MSRVDDRSAIKRLAQQLLSIESLGAPPDFFNILESVARRTSREMTQHAAYFLHNLDDRRHTEDQVKGIVDAFPEALLYPMNGQLPIQRAMLSYNAVSLIPAMAFGGTRCNVGGEEALGGLLLTIRDISIPVDFDGYEDANILQALAMSPFNDEKNLEVLKKLKELGLMQKEDIRKYNLIGCASFPEKEKRFEFFVDWDPEALLVTDWMDNRVIYQALDVDSNFGNRRERFELILKVSMKHFPENLGLLFQDCGPHTACEEAFRTLEKNEAIAAIRRCIPPSDNHPILHHAYRHLSDENVNLLIPHYPDAMYLRDSNNRTLFQSILISGKRNFIQHASFFLLATDDQVAEMDPVTELFPFAIAASDNTSDLAAVYRLLRRNPGLIWGRAARMNRGRKRNRSA